MTVCPNTFALLLTMPRRTFFAAALLGLAALILGGASPASANRFGPPWQAVVTIDGAVVYSQPDRGSQPVGPLPKWALVAVIGELKGADGGDWTAVADGYLPSSAVEEWGGSWVAEVATPSVSIYALPDAGSAIRRTVRAGDLVRVAGMSPGLNGDTNVWWATTEGYVGLRTIRPASGEWADGWTLPDPAEAPGGWWGAVRSTANLRAGATTAAPVVGTLGPGDRVKVLAEEPGQAVGGNPTWYRIDGGRYPGARIHSSLVNRLPAPQPTLAPLPDGASGEAWIVVDRATATLTFIRGGQAEFVTYVSLGRAGVDTPTGFYSTFGKYRADDMTSTSVPDADHSYDLPNVPFTQYYRLGGYAIHGTYWHDHFGSLQSQGCVNVTWNDAAYLFPLTAPAVPDGLNARWSDQEDATPVVILN